MSNTELFDVFVSYARADLRSDNPRRRSLPSVVQALRARNLRVFLDTQDIDGFVSLNPTLTSAIQRSKTVLAWYSPAYPTRPACRAELTLALIAARAAPANCPIVLAVNTEADTGHIVHAEVLGRKFLRSPAEGDDDALAAFSQCIADRVTACERPIGLIVGEPPRWHPSFVTGSSRFVGRLREVWELDAMLWPQRGTLSQGVLHDAPTTAACVTGLAGAGKSLLVLKYAMMLAPAYPGGVFWLPASGNDDPSEAQLELRCESAFRDIATALGIATERLSFERVRDEIAKRLSDDGRSCLWIVDDLPSGLDRATVERWLGPAPSRTVITTQSTEYDFLPTMGLGGMDVEEAMALLTDGNSPPDAVERDSAKSIVRALEGHPLALDVARAYLLHRPSYQEFMKRLTTPNPVADVLERAGIFSHNRSIQLSLLSSISLLDIDGLAALRLACSLPALPVSETLLRTLGRRVAELGNKTVDLGTPDIDRGIAALLEISLARRTEPGVVQVHTLVNRTERHLEPAIAEKLRPVAAGCLFNALDGVTLAHLRGVRHEARLAREFADQPRSITDLWVHRAGLMAETLTGAYQATLPGWRSQVRAADLISGAASWEAIRSRCGLSEVLRELGQSKEALSIAEEALYWSERNHGWHDVHTISAAEVVALAQAALGRREDALSMLERVRSAYAALGPHGAAGAMRSVANLSALGAAGGVAELLADAAARADTDQEALRMIIQLAPLETRAGRPAVAVRLLSQCRSKLSIMVGEQHPLMCECKVHLAQAHAALAEYSMAEELLREALTWYRNELGESHPTTVKTRQQLIAVQYQRGDPEVRQAVEDALAANRESARLFEAGDVRTALQTAELALAQMRDLFGPQSPETLTALHNVAQLAGSIDVERAASALFELCQLLPDEDSRRREEVELLGLAAEATAAAARARGDTAAAALWAARVLKVRDELSGPRSDEAVTAAWNLSVLLDEDGQQSEGMGVFIDRVSHMLAADEATLSADLRRIREAAGAKTRDARTRSGAALNAPGMSDEAMKEAASRANAMIDARTPWEALAEMQQLADEYTRRYGSMHPSTLQVVWLLATTAGRWGQTRGDSQLVRQAIEKLRLISRAQRAQLGEEHPSLLATLQNLAGLLAVEQPSEAARLDEQCLELARRVQGIEDPMTVVIALNAVESALQTGNHTGARSIFGAYLRWLTDRDPGRLAEPLQPARERALAAGKRLGLLSL